jgi:protein arginine kinase activator
MLMMCDHCHERPATVVISQTINGKQTNIYLCEMCASKTESFLAELNPLEKFMGAVFDQNDTKGVNQISCPNCGMTIDEFKKRSKIGCHMCYQVFDGYLEPIFKQIHGNTTHIGKRPEKYKKQIKKLKTIINLQLALQEALEVENYEEAARLRDEIKAVRNMDHMAGE